MDCICMKGDASNWRKWVHCCSRKGKCQKIRLLEEIGMAGGNNMDNYCMLSGEGIFWSGYHFIINIIYATLLYFCVAVCVLYREATSDCKELVSTHTLYSKLLRFFFFTFLGWGCYCACISPTQTPKFDSAVCFRYVNSLSLVFFKSHFSTSLLVNQFGSSWHSHLICDTCPHSTCSWDNSYHISELFPFLLWFSFWSIQAVS